VKQISKKNFKGENKKKFSFQLEKEMKKKEASTMCSFKSHCASPGGSFAQIIRESEPGF
jgi:hypothetical protein